MFEKLFARSGLTLDRLRTFREIVTARGISAAALNDPNRQSQYSRQLKELETYFGLELIRRGRGPMQLTEAGRKLNTIVGLTLGALDELREEFDQQPVHLAIGAGESLIQWMLLPRLGPLLAGKAPLTLQLQNLRNETILQELLDGQLDFGVMSRHHEHPDLKGTFIGQMEYGLFIPQSAWAGPIQEGATGKLLKELPLAVLASSQNIRQALEKEARKHRFELNIKLECSSHPQLAQVVQTAKVAAVMPIIAAASLSNAQVRMVQPAYMKALTRKIYLVWNRRAEAVRQSIEIYSKKLTQCLSAFPNSHPAPLITQHKNQGGQS